MVASPQFDANTRTPVVPPPPGSWDCQIHVFDDPATYPPAATRLYEPPPATMAEARKMHNALGLTYGVIVQATIYRTDHKLLVERLRENSNYRGVAIIDDTVDDRELLRLHEAGVRGARFNFAKFLELVPDMGEFERSIARVQELGWHAKIHGDVDELLSIEGALRKLKLPVVIDHLCRPDVRAGMDQPAVRFVLDMLKRENWWIMLSNADRYTEEAPPFTDTAAFARAFARAAPDRAIWGTDWPHIRYRKAMVNDGDLLNWLTESIEDDSLRKKILVDNPARLFGMAPSA